LAAFDAGPVAASSGGRTFSISSKPYPHPEERPKGASRRTQGRYPALRLNSCPASGRDPVTTKRARVSVHSVAPTPQQALWLELMPFYIREAWLLDERKLEEWLDLFTDDVLYFMPRRKNVPRRELHRELTPLGDLAILE